MDLRRCIAPHDDGAVLTVFVQPRARKDALAGFHGDALKIKISAPPVEGRANRSLEEFVAQVLDLPPTSVSVISGTRSRNKRVAVRGMSAPDVRVALGRVLSSRAHESGP